MKKTEIIFSILAIAGIAMKLSMLPGSSILVVISLSFLSCFYMYFGFAFFNNIPLKKIFKKESYKGISALRIIGAVGTGMALSASAIGILFKVQSYPGSEICLITGLFSCFVVAGISIIKFTKAKTPYYSKIFKRVLVYGAICLTWVLIPRKTWIEFKYRSMPAYTRALERSWADPNNRALRDSVEIEWEKATNQR